jgi:hypothetical protein
MWQEVKKKQQQQTNVKFTINLTTNVKAKATNAQTTTVASRMFHRSRQYEPGWKITPTSSTLPSIQIITIIELLKDDSHDMYPVSKVTRTILKKHF